MFGENPSMLEIATLEFLETLSDFSTLTKASYVNFVISYDPNARSKFLVNTWTTMQHFIMEKGPNHLQEAFADMPPMTISEAARLLKGKYCFLQTVI
jgi:hypothetical protein